MTAKSSEKTAARERMALTGENYTQALAEVRSLLPVNRAALRTHLRHVTP